MKIACLFMIVCVNLVFAQKERVKPSIAGGKLQKQIVRAGKYLMYSSFVQVNKFPSLILTLSNY